jgi:hypothetical protein
LLASSTRRSLSPAALHNYYLISSAAGQPVADMAELKNLTERISKHKIISSLLIDKNGHPLPLIPVHQLPPHHPESNINKNIANNKE